MPKDKFLEVLPLDENMMVMEPKDSLNSIGLPKVLPLISTGSDIGPGGISFPEPWLTQARFGEFKNIDIKKDVGLMSGLRQEDIRTENQSAWNLFGNTLAQVGGQLTLGTVEAASYLLDWEMYANLIKGTEDEFTNFVADAMKSGQESIEEGFPIERTFESRRQGFDLADPTFWAEHAPDIATTVSLIFPALGAAKAVSALGKATKATAKLGKVGIQTLEGVSAAIASRMAENTMESYPVMEQLFEEGIKKGLSEEDAKLIAGKKASKLWVANSANLIWDIPQYMFLFRGMGNTKASALSRGFKQKIKPLVKTTLQESAEEFDQFVMQEEALRSGRMAFGTEERPDTPFYHRFAEYLRDDEAWTAAWFGGLGGAVFHGISDIANRSRDIERRGAINSAEMANAAVLKNKEMYKAATNKVFFDLAMKNAVAGTLDRMRREVFSIKDMSKEDAVKWGLDEITYRQDAQKRLDDLDFFEDTYNRVYNTEYANPIIKNEMIANLVEQRFKEESIGELEEEISNLYNKYRSSYKKATSDIEELKRKKNRLAAIESTLDNIDISIKKLKSKKKSTEFLDKKKEVLLKEKDVLKEKGKILKEKILKDEVLKVSELVNIMESSEDEKIIELEVSKEIQTSYLEDLKEGFKDLKDTKKQKEREESYKEEERKIVREEEKEKKVKKKASERKKTEEKEEKVESTQYNDPKEVAKLNLSALEALKKRFDTQIPEEIFSAVERIRDVAITKGINKDFLDEFDFGENSESRVKVISEILSSTERNKNIEALKDAILESFEDLNFVAVWRDVGYSAKDSKGKRDPEKDKKDTSAEAEGIPEGSLEHTTILKSTANEYEYEKNPDGFYVKRTSKYGKGTRPLSVLERDKPGNLVPTSLKNEGVIDFAFVNSIDSLPSGTEIRFSIGTEFKGFERFKDSHKTIHIKIEALNTTTNRWTIVGQLPATDENAIKKFDKETARLLNEAGLGFKVLDKIRKRIFDSKKSFKTTVVKKFGGWVNNLRDGEGNPILVKPSTLTYTNKIGNVVPGTEETVLAIYSEFEGSGEYSVPEKSDIEQSLRLYKEGTNNAVYAVIPNGAGDPFPAKLIVSSLNQEAQEKVITILSEIKGRDNWKEKADAINEIVYQGDRTTGKQKFQIRGTKLVYYNPIDESDHTVNILKELPGHRDGIIALLLTKERRVLKERINTSGEYVDPITGTTYNNYNTFLNETGIITTDVAPGNHFFNASFSFDPNIESTEKEKEIPTIKEKPPKETKIPTTKRQRPDFKNARRLKVSDNYEYLDPNSIVRINPDKAKTWFKKKFPNVPLEIIEGLIHIAETGQYAYGEFHDAMVTLSKMAPLGIEYHEAFHVVSHSFLTPEQWESILKEARAIYSNKTKLYRQAKNDKEVEEFLADDFAEFLISGKNTYTKKEKGAIEKFFRMILTYIKHLLGMNLTIEELFEHIKVAKFRGEAALVEEGLPRLIESFSTSPVEQADAIRTVAFSIKEKIDERIQSGELVDRSRLKDSIKDIFEEIKAEFREDLEIVEEDFQNKIITEGQRDDITISIRKLLDNFGVDSEGKITKSLIGDLALSDIRQYIGLKMWSKMEKQDEDFDIEPGEQREKVYGVSWFEVERRLPDEIAEYLYFLPEVSKEIKPGEWEFYKNVYGRNRGSNFNSVYSHIRLILAGSETLEDMIYILRSNPTHGPTLKKIAWDIENKVTEQFKSLFFRTFSNQHMRFSTLVYSGLTGKRRYTPIKTNRQDITEQVVSQWREDFNNPMVNKILLKDGNINPNLAKRGLDAIEKIAEKIKDTKEVKEENIKGITKILDAIGIRISPESIRFHIKKKIRPKRPQADAEEFISILTGKGGIVFLFKKLSERINIFDTESRNIGRLAEIQTVFEVDSFTGTFIMGTGNRAWSLSPNSDMSKKFAKFKSDDESVVKQLVETYLESPYNNPVANDPTLQSLWLQKIRDSENTRSALEVATFDTVRLQVPGIPGVSYKKMSKLDRARTWMNFFLNRGSKRGWFSIPTPSDKGRTHFIHFDKLSRDVNVRKRETMKLVLQEYARIKQAEQQIIDLPEDKLISHYHYKENTKNKRDGSGNAFKFHFFPELNNVLIKEGNLVVVDDTVKEEIRKVIQDSIQGEINTQTELLLSTGVIGKNEKGEFINIELDSESLKNVYGGSIKAFIEDYVYNYVSAYAEITRILNGDIAFYKSTEALSKRSYESSSTGLDYRIDEVGGVSEVFQGTVLEDEIVDMEIKKPHLFESWIKGLEHLKLTTTEANKLVEKYKKTNRTDAQGYVGLNYYIGLLKGKGVWTSKYEAALESIKRGDPTPIADRILFGPFKTFYFGLHLEDNMMVPIQIKHSIIPLLPALTKRKGFEKLDKLRTDAEEQKVDEVNFKTGVKVGASGVRAHTDTENLHKTKLRSQNRRESQEVPYKELPKQLHGVQFAKQIIADIDSLDEETLYHIEGKPYKGKEIKDLYQGISAYNIEESFNQELKAQSTPDKMKKLVLKDSKQGPLSSDIEKTIENAPLSFPTISKLAEKVLTSRFKNEVTKQKLPGIYSVLVSDFGYEENEGLNFVEVVVDGEKVKAAEIMLPYPFLEKLYDEGFKGIENEELDISNVPLSLKQGVLYHTPGHGKKSSIPVVIKAFLPKEMGQIIMVPTGITAQENSDFDIDKSSLILPHYELSVDKEKITKIRYDYTKYISENSRKQRENALIDISLSILSNINSFKELITPVTAVNMELHADFILKHLEIKPLIWTFPSTQDEFYFRNLAGTVLRSDFVIFQNAHIVRQDTKKDIRIEIIFDGKSQNNLHGIKNLDGNLITEDYSEGISATVDNANKPIMGILNLSRFTSRVWDVIVGSGHGLKTADLFISQPIIRRLSELYGNKGETLVAEKEALKQVIEEVKNLSGINKMMKGFFDISTKELENGIKAKGEERTKKHYEVQMRILSSFIEYRKLGEEIFQESVSMRSDAMGLGPTMSDGIAFLNQIKRVETWPALERYPRLYAFAEFGYRRPIEHLSKEFPWMQSSFQAVRESIEENLGIRLQEEDMELINYDFLTYLYSKDTTKFKDVYGEGNRERLFIGDNSIANQLVALKEDMEIKMKENPDFQGNKLVSILKPFFTADVTRTLKFVFFNNAGRLSDSEVEEIRNSWQQLLRDPKTEKFASNLAEYALLANGMGFETGSFIHLIPSEWFQSKGLFDFQGDIVRGLYSKYDPVSTDNFIDQFLRHNNSNNRWVPRIRLDDKGKPLNAKEVKKQDEIPTSILLDLREDSNPSFVDSKGNKRFYPYLKILKPKAVHPETRALISPPITRLYKLMGFHDGDINLGVYHKITSLGFKNHLKEYFFDNDNVKTIVPTNRDRVDYSKKSDFHSYGFIMKEEFAKDRAEFIEEEEEIVDIEQPIKEVGKSKIVINKEEQYTKERYDAALETSKTFMSNFEQLKVPIKDEHGNEYWNSEGYYMAQRTSNLEEKSKIAIISKQGGAASRKVRRQFTLDQNEENRLQYMMNAVKAKFQNNPDLTQKLLNTGTQEIIEKNYWKDTLFGVYDKTLKGANILGKVLMQVRNKLQEQPSSKPLLQITVEDKKARDIELDKRLLQILAPFGVTLEMVDNMKERVGVDAIGASLIFERLILVAQGKANLKTIPEEFSHFFIELLGDNNPLVKRMMELVPQTEKYQKVKQEYSELAEGLISDTDEYLRKETAGKLLSDHIVDRWQESKTEGIGGQILRTIKLIIQRILNIFRSAKEVSIRKEIERVYGGVANDILFDVTVDLDVRNLTSRTYFQKNPDSIENKDIKVGEQEFKKSPKVDITSLRKLVDDVRIILKKEITLAKKKKKFEASEKYGQLLETLKDIEDFEGMGAFIEKAFEDTKKTVDRFNETVNSTTLNGRAKIGKLRDIRSFLKHYEDVFPELGSFIDKQIRLGNMKKEDLKEDILAALDYINATYPKLKKSYLEEGIPLQAKILWEEVPHEELNRSAKTEDEKLDLEKFTEQFVIADRDETSAMLYLDEAIGSDDVVFAAFAKSMKKMLYEATDEKVPVIADLQEKTKKFISSMKKFRDQTPEAIYGSLIDEVVDYQWNEKEGKYEPKVRPSLLSALDWTKFNKAEQNMYSSIENIGSTRKRKMKAAQWYEKNTILRKDWKEVLDAKKKEFGGADTLGFKLWMERNGRQATGEVYDLASKFKIEYEGIEYIAKNFLTEPDSKKYSNKRFESLSAPEREYLDYITNLYLEHQEVYSEDARRGFSLPAIYKTSRAKLFTEGPIAMVKEWYNETIQKTERDEMIYGPMASGDDNLIPIYYNFDIDAKDVSYDLFGSIGRYVGAAIEYKHKAGFADIVDSMRDTMEARRFPKEGNIFERAAKVFGLERKELKSKHEESNIQKHFKAFIESNFYGRTRETRTKVDKWVDLALSYTSALMLGGNIFQATTDLVRGKMHAWTETFGKEFATPTTLAEAEVAYFANMHNFFSDMGKAVPETIIGQIVQMIDPARHTEQDFKNLKTASFVRRTPGALFIQSGTDHDLAVTFMIAVLKTFKVYNKDGRVFKNDAGKDKTLWEALHATDSKGRIKLDKNIAYFEHSPREGYTIRIKDLQDLRNRIHATRTQIEGIRNAFDRPVANRYTLIRPIMLFRSWIMPGFNRRWGRRWLKRTFNQESARWEEGHYPISARFVKYHWNNLFRIQQEIDMRWTVMTPTERKAILATVVDTAVIILAWSTYLLMSGDDDDDKKNWSYKFIRYQSRRLAAELSFWFNPYETFKIIKSPVATQGIINSAGKLLVQFAHPGEEFQRNTGKWPKGYNKLKARAQEMIPIWVKLKAIKDPDEALKAFSRIL